MLHDPVFWFMVAVLIFVALVGKKVWIAMTTSLDARADRIKTDLDEAAKIRDEAQDLLAQYQRKQRDAAKEADEIVDRARNEADRYSHRAKENLDAALARREQLASERIAHAEKAAVEEIRRVAADIAVEATRKLLAEEMTGVRADKMIDQAIQDLPGKLN